MDHAETGEGIPNPTAPGPVAPRAGRPLPDWALERARGELFDVDDDSAVIVRAWQIVSETQELDDERHDEYDDPDSGGEG